MFESRLRILIFPLAMMAGASGSVGSQEFPSKPVRIIAAGPGGSSDMSARLLASGLSANLGHQVIVENRLAGTTLDIVAKAPADGYTLLVGGSTLWVSPLWQETRYDMLRDFLPVTMVATGPNVLVVHPSLPARSVKELIALAKANPGVLNYSSAVSGSTSHLGAELFKHMAGVNIVRINFKNGASRMASLVAGEVQLEFATPGTAAPFIKSGRVRALAVTSLEPSPLAPGVPTIAASGVPGYESVGAWAMFAPPRTPAVIVARLAQESARVLTQPDVRQKFLSGGAESAGSSPEALAAAIKSEMVRMGKIIKQAGIRAEQ